MDGDKDLEEVKEILRDIWAGFTASFDARDVIDESYSKRIISETTRDKMMQAKDSKEATRCFLIHLENSATIDTLWKVHTMLQKTSKDHDSHKCLCKILSNRLHSSKQGTLTSDWEESVKTSISTVDHFNAGIHRLGESGTGDHKKKIIPNLLEDPLDLEGNSSTSMRQVVCHSIRSQGSKCSQLPVDKQDKMESFLDACAEGDVPRVVTFLSQRHSPNGTDHRRGRPLTISAGEGHRNVVSQLIASGADVHMKDQNGRTALHYASEMGHLKVVRVLLDAGAEIDEEDGDHSTALILAAKKGHRDVVSHLIASGAIVGKKDRNVRTPLHYASEMGDLETVETIVEAGAEIDEMSQDHFTPLMLAVHTEQVAVISYLLDHGADISKHGKRGLTQKSEVENFSRKAGRRTFSYAIKHKHRTAAEVLIINGVGIEGLLSTSPPMTALMWTAQEGYDSLTKQLILQGVNVNFQNHDGRTALQLAAHCGQLEIVKRLLNAGAEIDLEDQHHHTPLVLSVEAKKYDIMLHLITAGADVAQLAKHVSRDLGRETLSYAINYKSVDVAKVLTAKGVGIKGFLSTSPPMTALMWMAREGYDSLTKELILQGVKVNYQNPDGRTALQLAAHCGQLEIVQILLNNGAEKDLEDKHHHTPLVLSVMGKKYDVMLHLIKSGADVTRLAKCTYSVKDLGRKALSYAVNHKHTDVAKYLITNGVGIKGFLSTNPHMTALMWTAQEGYDSLTKELILQRVNVNYQNPYDHTALHFASQHNHIQCGILLVEAGADVSIVNKASQTPLDLSSNEFKDAILQTLSFQTKKTVCVIGNALSGKSTLIASLQNENVSFMRKFCNRLFGVRDISERTAGIEPVSLSSKRYGDVMFFDFAGQHEYHGPHEMFLESILSKGLSTVTIIVVVRATEEESAICHQLNRWLHPFFKMSSSTNPVRVIVIGSHMDKVKRKVEAKEKLELCYETIKDSLRDVPLKFEDLCYLDCRQPYSSDIFKLCKYLKDVPPPQYKNVHIGYSIPWVISRIRSSIQFAKKVISVLEFSDWIAHNKANLPTNLPPAEEVCKHLSSTGHFLYLPSREGASNGWLVLDLPSILHEVYGTLFSPSKKIVNKFGLLNCQRLSDLFPTLDPSMICDVLISLEFCFEVDPSILTESIHLMDNSDEGHNCLFFPALVSTYPPKFFDVPSESRMNHNIAWHLVVNALLFISPCLLQTMILRLAAHHVFHHKRGSEAREHCSEVWWNGVFWQSAGEVDIAVQISDNAVVQVIGRSAVSPEGLCMYMSRVIQDIFDTIHDLSPSLSGTAYMIHPVNPQALLENPRSPSPQEMFPVDFILESRRNDEKSCLSCTGKEKTAVRNLISEVFCGFEPSVDVIKQFQRTSYPPKQTPPPTYQSTGSTASTNPLPTMLDDPLRTTPTDPLLNTSDDPLSRPSKAESDPLPTTSSDPLKTTPTDPLLTTPTINELQRLIIRHIALEWQSFGLELDIEVSVLQIIEEDNPRSVERCCRMMFTRWLARDEGTGGEPRVWRTVLKALKNFGYMTLVGDVERTLFEQK